MRLIPPLCLELGSIHEVKRMQADPALEGSAQSVMRSCQRESVTVLNVEVHIEIRNSGCFIQTGRLLFEAQLAMND
jgi:hypothetical protein